MKKVFLVLAVVFLVSCGGSSSTKTVSSDSCLVKCDSVKIDTLKK